MKKFLFFSILCFGLLTLIYFYTRDDSTLSQYIIAIVAIIGGEIISLCLPNKETIYYKIKNKRFNKKERNVSFDLYNIIEYPIEIKYIKTEPSFYHSISPGTILMLEIDNVAITNFFPPTPYEKELLTISPKNMRHCLIELGDYKVNVNDENGEKIGELKRKRIIIRTNIGEIVLKYPRGARK